MVPFIVMLTVLAGCSFLKPSAGEEHDYLLSSLKSPASTAAQTQSRAYAIRILPVELPAYLQTSDMAVRVGTNELYFAKFNQWAESLETGIRRVLAENLRAAGKEVLTDEPAPNDVKVYTVSVQVLACEAKDMNGQGSVLFEAAWEISATGTPSLSPTRGIFRAAPSPWHPGDYAGLARQLSQALTDFSGTLEQAISEQANDQAGP